MKFIALTFCLITLSTTSYCQNIYYDAIKLKKYIFNDTLSYSTPEAKNLQNQISRLTDTVNKIDTAATVKLANDTIKRNTLIAQRKTINNNNRDTLFSILKKYFPSLLNIDSLSANTFKNNPFFDSLIIGGKPDNEGNNYFKSSYISGVFSSIGGLDVTNIADALAKFLVKRAKQELTIAFFDKFDTLIKKYPDLQTVFPNTYLAFTVAGEEIYNYEGYIQTLRESFQKDLDAIDKNLPSIIDNHTIFFTNHPALAATLNSGCYFAGQLKDKVHPGQIIEDYPSEYLDPLNANWKGAIQTLQLFSASLRDTAFHDTTGNYWVSAKQIKNLVNDKVAFQIYLGLIYQQAKTFNTDSSGNASAIVFKETTLNMLLNTASKNISPLRDFVTAISQRTEKLNILIKNNTKPATDSLAVEQYYTYFNTSLDLLKQCTKITDIPVFRTLIKDTLSKRMDDYFNVAQSTGNIVVDITRRNYSSAIVNTVHVYDLVSTSKTDTIKESIKDKNTVMGSVFKYGSFMAATLEAKNSDEMENTIEAFALPQGSSRVKRESDFNVSLNGYAGLFYGFERIKGLDSGKLKANIYGLTAPIGIATSWGHHVLFFNTGKHQWSTSIYVSLIDLGAVAAFRFKDTTTAQVPTIQLKDIFSPGAFLSIGIPKTPISFNIGAQMGPNLRKVSDKSNDYSNNIYWRYSASLCVDIPVLNFYTKSR